VAAEARLGLEDRDLVPQRQQQGGGEAGDAGADDSDALTGWCCVRTHEGFGALLRARSGTGFILPTMPNQDMTLSA